MQEDIHDYGGKFDKRPIEWSHPFDRLACTVARVDADILTYCVDIYECPAEAVEETTGPDAAARLTFAALCLKMAEVDRKSRPLIFGAVLSDNDERLHPCGETFIEYLRVSKRNLLGLENNGDIAWGIGHGAVSVSTYTTKAGVGRAWRDIEAKIEWLGDCQEHGMIPELQDALLLEATHLSTNSTTASANRPSLAQCATWTAARLVQFGLPERLTDMVSSGGSIRGLLARVNQALKGSNAGYTPWDYIKQWVKAKLWSHSESSVSEPPSHPLCNLSGQLILMF